MNYFKLILVTVTPIVLLTFSACDNSNDPETRNWQLVWQDEFDGPAGQLPDSTNWNFGVGTNWGNNQLEYATDRPENVSLDGAGSLAIVAREESYITII